MAKFMVDTHLFREIGELLVGRDSTALVELIKNSYDADATEVIVDGQNLDDPHRGKITIRDNGIGMTRTHFELGFLRIASRLKEHGKRLSFIFQRRYTGAKGIGTDDEGGCNRNAYKVTIREPWYRTPMPKSPDAFLSGMSQYGPWLSINEMEGLNATNTLYVVTFRNREPKAWYRWALALLSSTAQRQIRRIGRRYADGLIKYEPGALGKIELPALREDADHKSLYARAVGALLSEDLRMAKAIADSARL